MIQMHARASAAQGSASIVPADNSHEWTDRKAHAQAVRAANARTVSGRRRFVDPTTCEKDYTEAENEFMQAMHEYKIRSGRMFPTWSEVLEVFKGLGYEKMASAEEEETAPPEPTRPARRNASPSLALSRVRDSA